MLPTLIALGSVADPRVELQARLDAYGWPNAVNLALKEVRRPGRPWTKNASTWLTSVMLADRDVAHALELEHDLHRGEGTLLAELMLSHAPHAPTSNSWDAAYFHQLQLRSIQQVLAHNSINLSPMESMSYFWAARTHMTRRRLQRLQPPTVCEVGFGSGMSAAILLTATAAETSTRRGGGQMHIFDCRHCAGGSTGKDIFLSYLNAVFPGRIRTHHGVSNATLPAFAAAHPAEKCDIFHIDGGHRFKEVAWDIKHARALSHKGTLVLIDDTVPGHPPFRATREAEKRGELRILETLAGTLSPDAVMATYRGFRTAEDGRRVRRFRQKVRTHWQLARFVYPE